VSFGEAYPSLLPTIMPEIGLTRACLSGSLTVAYWLVEHKVFTEKKIVYVFKWCCGMGRLLEAQWLAERFNLTSVDVRRDDNCALLQSCRNWFNG
jgi:hypothetical protein